MQQEFLRSSKMGVGRMSKDKKTFTIGVLIGNVHSPYTIQLLQGISEAAKEKELNVLYFLGTHSSYLLESMLGQSKETNYDYQFNTIYDYANLGGLDALIVSYGSLCIFLEEMNKDLFLSRFKGIPYLLLEDEEEGDNTSFMIADNYSGMYQLSEHLLKDHGYTRFVYVSGPKGNKDAEERMLAFMDACARYEINIPEDAIEYGDFSEYAYTQVDSLLNKYPDTQAIVCANDEMASAAYRVCKARGLNVGKDIAITGFDNNVNAEMANPPITTVEQSSFNMGHIALEKAYQLCMGQTVGGIRIPTKFKKRESCGCSLGDFLDREVQKGIEEKVIAKKILKAVMKTERNEVVYQNCYEKVLRIVEQVFTLRENASNEITAADTIAIMDIVESINEGENGKYISLMALSNEIVKLFSYLSREAQSLERKREILHILTEVQKKIQAYIASIKNNQLTEFQRKSWFVQMIAREMAENLDAEEEFYLSAIGNLRLLGVKSSYIYLFDKAVKHYKGDPWECPEKLFLASYHAGEEAVSYKKKDRPVVSAEQGFPKYLRDANGHQLSAFILFSDERQYGLLLCEIDPADMSIIYFTSLQIGTALRFLELRKREMKIRNQLQESFNTIKAKNEVLNFISEYDELTNLLNRRGFMERALAVSQSTQYIGKKAVFIFGDLDHLKEINDCFGHSEGDYAIKTAGETLKESLHQKSILGRIGGDEFVAMSIAGQYTSVETLKKQIKQSFAEKNRVSGKPYYVEMSVGHFEFVIGENQDLTAIIKKADELLYHDKRSRRASISRT